MNQCTLFWIVCVGLDGVIATISLHQHSRRFAYITSLPLFPRQ